MLFLRHEDRIKQIPRNVVLVRLAISNTGPEIGNRIEFHVEIAAKNLRHILADAKFPQVLEIRQSLEEQNALDQLIGVLHLINRFPVLVIAELVEAPVFQHAGVQEVLIDRRQLVFQDFVEVFDDGSVAFHVVLQDRRVVIGFRNCKEKAPQCGAF